MPVAEETDYDGGLKRFIGISVKVNNLESLGCWSSRTKKEVLLLPVGSAELVDHE